MKSLDRSLAESQTVILTAYQEAAPYLVTDCSTTVINDLVQRCEGYQLDQVLSLPGENLRGEQFMEYYADEAAMDQLILELLYEPKT